MKCVLLLLVYFTVPCLLLLSLCVDVLLVCAEGYTQVTGVMAMMMTGRVLLVCALCVLWCVAGGVYARDVDTNALGGCMASGVLGENGSHMPDGCNKTAITVPLRSVLPITAVEASDGGNDALVMQNNSNSSKTSDAGASTAGSSTGSAGGPGPGGAGAAGAPGGGSAAGEGAGSAGSSAPAASPSAVSPAVTAGPPGVDSSAGSSGGTAGSSGTNPSNTTGESSTGNQTPAAAAAHNSSLPEGPAGTTSGTEHKGREEEEEEEEEKQQQSDETQVQQQQHEHPAESG
ncbi:mucin-associated surface protein (MASP), partial [Trypanosoma cruzi]